nr:helix-turn-helix domain-containing protein [Paenibacillus sp. IHB B 3415]
MGRTKEFEINEVLDKAVQLFWMQGYEKTSMQDLVNFMGIHRRSIYDSFGDKHALYMKALKLHWSRRPFLII